MPIVLLAFHIFPSLIKHLYGWINIFRYFQTNIHKKKSKYTSPLFIYAPAAAHHNFLAPQRKNAVDGYDAKPFIYHQKNL